MVPACLELRFKMQVTIHNLYIDLNFLKVMLQNVVFDQVCDEEIMTNDDNFESNLITSIY